MNSYRAGLLCQAIDAIELRGPIPNDLQIDQLNSIAQISQRDSSEAYIYHEVQRDLWFLQDRKVVNFDRETTSLPAEEVSKINQAWRQYMQTAIDGRVLKIQDRYAVVIRENARLKKSLHSDIFGTNK